MHMEQYNRCLGCMEEKAEAPTCPCCGWVAGNAPESALHLTPGTLLNNKYLIGKALGQGGFGITYLAWDINLNLKLAIKEYLPQELAYRSGGQSEVSIYKKTLAGHFYYGLEKFLQEARTLARFVEHPNIVSVRDYFKANGTAYLVMNHIEGITLKEYLESKTEPLTFTQALDIFMPVLDALKEVHALDILHRDISPDNLLVNSRGRVVLIDFGAARQAIGEKSHSMSVIMKAGYSPEEQYRSKGVQGPWTDIYAVAATIYRSITGRLAPESLDRLAEDTLAPPSQLNAEISETQEKALLKALAVRAKDRYQTLSEFQGALLGAKPVADPQAVEEDKTASPKFVDWIYYVNYSEDGQIYKIRTDGSGRTRVNNDNSRYLNVVGDWIYYSNESDNYKIYKIRIDGSERTRVNNDSSWFLNVVGDWVYYRNFSDGNKLYKIHTDGSKRTRVNDDSSWSINVVDDWIYYCSLFDGSNIYKIRTDGSERTRVNDDDSWFLNVVDDWIYYINDSDNYKIYKIRTDGRERTRVNDDDSVYLNVVGDWIYYTNESDGDKFYKIRTDGSERQLVN